jgi:hypothetical protein
MMAYSVFPTAVIQYRPPAPTPTPIPTPTPAPTPCLPCLDHLSISHLNTVTVRPQVQNCDNTANKRDFVTLDFKSGNGLLDHTNHSADLKNSSEHWQ